MFVGGRHWKVLVLLMIQTGMIGMVVLGGDREKDVKSTVSVLNEIGVGGLSLEVATDNEAYLLNLMQRSLRESNCRGFHWRNISENRPQAKGVERAVGMPGIETDMASGSRKLMRPRLGPSSSHINTFRRSRLSKSTKYQPVPHGTQKKTMENAMKEWNWRCRVLQPGRGSHFHMSWQVGAQEEPPARVTQAFQSDVLINPSAK